MVRAFSICVGWSLHGESAVEVGVIKCDKRPGVRLKLNWPRIRSAKAGDQVLAGDTAWLIVDLMSLLQTLVAEITTLTREERIMEDPPPPKESNGSAPSWHCETGMLLREDDCGRSRG